LRALLLGVRGDGLLFREAVPGEAEEASPDDHQGPRGVTLSGGVWTDEAFVPVNRSGVGHLRVYGPHIENGSRPIHDGMRGHGPLASGLGLSEAVCKTSDPGSKKATQPINSFCAQVQRRLVKHIGGETRRLQMCLDRAVFKCSLRGKRMSEKIAIPEAHCFGSGVDFKVKDRY